VKKLISIGVALALLVTFMVPVAVGADFPTDPGTYSKTPFGILGSAIVLVGNIVNDLATTIDGLGLPVTAAEIAGVLGSVGDWTGINLAWMTDMTGWSMVAVGDVVTVIEPLAATLAFDEYTKPIADIFYVIGARIFDAWDAIATSGSADLPGPGIGLPVG
jgi:hypothetical protein